MISNDEFFRQMNENFELIHKRMDFLHKETKEDIEFIKKDLDSLKSEYKTHIAVGEALENQKKRVTLTKNQKIGIFLGITPLLLAIYSLFFR